MFNLIIGFMSMSSLVLITLAATGLYGKTLGDAEEVTVFENDYLH